MSHEILVTIIIPTRNRSEKLNVLLENIFIPLGRWAKPGKREAEIIVIDDNSTDGTSDLSKIHGGAKSKYPCNLVYLRNATNIGPGPARNRGLDSANGKWIIFLDDDDSLNLSELQSLLELIASDRVDNVDLVAHSLKNTSYRVLDGAEQLFRNVLLYRERQEVFNFLFRRDFLTEQKIRFRSGLHEDISFVLAAIYHSKNIIFLNSQVVLKCESEDSITRGMSTSRIDGYMQAYEDTRELLANESSGERQDLIGQFFTQQLGIFMWTISSVAEISNASLLLEHLNSYSGRGYWGADMQQAKIYDRRSTNFLFAGSLWLKGRSSDLAKLAVDLRDVFRTHLSCRDLESSIFLGPDEVRACCKRFYVNGTRKGDVVLLKADEAISFDAITNAKSQLKRRINTGEDCECSGCPYIERFEDKTSKIAYISMENFNYCNMRCTYCSPKYYDGTEASYDAEKIIRSLCDSEAISDCHVVWGGGEPTLSKRFKPVNDYLAIHPGVNKIRVLSNSLRSSEDLIKFLSTKKFHLVTSIDAGTESTFSQIRGKAGLDQVLTNLSHYSRAVDDPLRVTIKYIISEGNCASTELAAFQEKILEFNLQNCLFQISCDFTMSRALTPQINAIYELGIRLKDIGVEYVFLDDLVRDRLIVEQTNFIDLQNHLTALGLGSDFLSFGSSKKKFIVWGTGRQAEWIRSTSLTGRNGCVQEVVSSLPSNWKPENRDKHQLFILPAGVQSSYEIITSIKQAGLEHYIYKGVVV
jgi:hypothetical protein